MSNVSNIKVKRGNILVASGSSVEITGSQVRTSGDLVVGGKITANEFSVTYVTSSVLYQSGSTKFGDTADDTHVFTGSVNITGTLSASFVQGDGSGLTNLVIPASVNSLTAGNNIVVSSPTGSVTVSLTSSITSGLTDLTASNISGNVGKFATLSASSAEFSSTAQFSGNILVYGTASLSANPTAAYVFYSSSMDRLVAFPGLYVSGALTASSEISGTSAFFTSVNAGTVSASSISGSFSGSGAQLNSLNVGNVSSGILGTVYGGTGLSVNPTAIGNGELLIGNDNTDAFVKATLSSGSGIAITNGPGTITIASTITQGVTQVVAGDNIGITTNGTVVTASLSSSVSGLTNLSSSAITGSDVLINNSLAVLASLARSRNTVSTSYSVGSKDQIILAIVTGSGDLVVTLPAPTAIDGRELVVKRTDDATQIGAVVVSSSNGGTIDSSDTFFELNGPFESITLLADSGSNKWFIL